MRTYMLSGERGYKCAYYMCTLNANCTLVHLELYWCGMVWYGMCVQLGAYTRTVFDARVIYIVLVNSTTITSTGSVQFMCNPIHS